MKTFGGRLKNLNECQRPEKVIVAILTDGQENSSIEFKKDKILKMIKHQKEAYSWEFIFLAANQDAIGEGMSFGLDTNDCFNFAATGKGTRDAYLRMSSCVTQYRH